MTDIVEALRDFACHLLPAREAYGDEIDTLNQAANEIERLRAALEIWQEAVRVNATMEGPVYMGVSSTLGRKAWEATRAALEGKNDD